MSFDALFVYTMTGVIAYICWKWWVELGRHEFRRLVSREASDL